MRLTPDQHQYIKDQLTTLAPGSEVYLFGSRTDDQARGGDIDILWITPTKIPLRVLRQFRVGFFKRFGWQKVDLVNFETTSTDHFKQIALENAIPL